ncbi:MAG: hypothetical protein RL134_105 [Actinomycetota bacterium]|jgi:hypothetical protein
MGYLRVVKRFPIVLVSVLAAALAISLPVAQASPSPVGPSAKPKPPLADVFPYCSWWLETTPQTMNVAFPDTSATYWTTPYLALPGMSIEVAGTFPETRFLAFTAYNNAGGVYESATGAPSQITDFEIVPAPGTPEPNPWAETSAPDTPPGGTFTVTLREGVDPGDANAIPILPPNPQPQGKAPANLGFLVMRVYLPEGGAPDVSLPKLTVVDAQGNRTTLPACSGKGMAAMGKISKAAKFLSIMKQIKAGTWPSPQPAPCTTEPGGCPPPYGFFRASAATTNSFFPNDANAYASMLFTPTPGEVVVIKMLAPTTPWNVEGGTTPVPWPNDDYQLRYWSVCNNVYAAPYPVVANPKPKKGTTYGCVADNAAVRDSDGYVTIAISTPKSRPRNATTTQGVNWLPTSVSKPKDMEMVALRNMLASEGFANAVQNVPSGSDAAATAAVMGDYYPDVAVCSTADFERGGAAACFAATE